MTSPMQLCRTTLLSRVTGLSRRLIVLGVVPLIAGLLFVSTGGAFFDDEPAKTGPSREELEAALEKKLTGAVLNGTFTIDGRPIPPVSEKYTISKATKLAGDDWLIESRMQYGKIDATVPIVMPIQWAGTTPVMVLDKVEIPGMGTFSSRVLFDGDRYAGTWQHDAVGGHMFGKVIWGDAAKPADAVKPATAKPATDK